MKRLLLALVLSVAVAAAAGIDGKWTTEIAARAPKKGGKQGATPKAMEVTFNLKSDGSTITGTMTGGGGKRARSMPIQDGKLNGDSFSFTTVQKTKKGENKLSWSGKLKGDELTGTRSRDGAKRGQPFTAKRAS